MRWTWSSDFLIQLVERRAESIQDLVTAGRKAIHPGRLGSFRFRRAEPVALRHARQHRIEGAWAQTISVVMQFLKHPLTIDAASVGRMMENMDFPEGKEELADNRIAHGFESISPTFVIDSRLRTGAVGAMRCDEGSGDPGGARVCADVCSPRHPFGLNRYPTQGSVTR
jgi:hypothetical protein